MSRAGAAPLVLGALAVLAGAAFLRDVGALPGLSSRNVVAFVLGVAIGLASARLMGKTLGRPIMIAVTSAILVLVVAQGMEIDGVRRWLAVGPITLQPALILCPLLLAMRDERESGSTALWLVVPAVLIVLQPDAATFAAFAAGIATELFQRRSTVERALRHGSISTGAGIIVGALIVLAFIGIRTPPPVAFVEGTKALAVTSGMVAMALHGAALVLMIAALACARHQRGWAVASYFVVCAVAAGFWSFPMPIAGGSPSHMIGFGLAAGWLTARGSAARQAPPA